jgi:general secretion pathway protein N
VTFFTRHRRPQAPRAPGRLLARASSATAPWSWALAGVLTGLLLSVLLFAPARWLAAVVRQASSGQVLLHDARGTVWSGSARLTLTGGAGSVDAATLPSRLDWHLQPGLAGLAVQLQASCCLAQPWDFGLEPRWGGVQVRAADQSSNWPAGLLAGLGTPFNTIAPQGQLVLTTRGFSLTWVAGRLQVAGQAQLDAEDVSSRLSTLRPLGSYRFTLSGGTTPELVLVTLQGALQLSGRGQWAGGKLRFVGEAGNAPEHQAALANLVNIIGRREGGRSVIRLG